MVLVGLLGFAQAQNNSNDTRKAPRAANPTEQRGSGGPGGPNRQPAKTALESDCYSDADSDQAIALFELIDRLCGDYAIDRDRLYNTGQSMGGMFALSTNIARPDLFAASYLVACQWDTKEFYKFAKKPMWIVVAEGDPKATSGPIEDVMIDDLIPYIDSHYRTIATREGRGIGGFSMGGRGTLLLAFKHPDLFCAASSVASAVVMSNQFKFEDWTISEQRRGPFRP